jgi:RNA polymerase sigma-70 factor (ECF subfamily)
MSNSASSFSDRVRGCAECIAESGAPALAGLFDLTAQRLVRFAVTITRNQHDAEDAVQAALVRVVSDCHLLRRAACPWAYLLRMVRNEALVILRRRRRWSLLENLTDLLTRRAVDQVEQEESFRAVWLALRKLPAEQSAVVVLKIWEELTFAQIAEVLSVPAATAASRYRYALEKLAGQLRGHEAEVHHE